MVRYRRLWTGTWAVALSLLVGGLLPGGMLEAKLITYEVSGTVELIHTDVPVLGSVPPEIQFPLFTVTSTWSATFTLDDDESVYDEIRIGSSQGTKGYISSPGPPMDFTVNLHYAGGGGAYTFSAPAIGDLEFWVGNDLVEVTRPPPFETVTPGGDKLTVVSWVTSGLDDVPWDRQFIILYLRDSTATAFSDDLIPESLDIADFDDNKFNVTFTTADGFALKHLQLFVDDLSLVSIPEPSTCLLAALGSIGLLFHRGFRVRCSDVLPLAMRRGLMNAEHPLWTKVMAFAAAFLMALGHSEVSVAGSTTYSITPLGGAKISREITSGHITTDGTLGPLTEANILAMSVNIGVGTHIGNSPGEFEFPLHSETLNLNNAVLSIQGIVEATPTGIVIPMAANIGERNELLLSKGGLTFVSWASVFVDYSGTFLEGLVENQSVSGATIANTGLGFPASGVIAQVIPEPSAMSLALLGLLVLSSKLRLACLIRRGGGSSCGHSAT